MFFEKPGFLCHPQGRERAARLRVRDREVAFLGLAAELRAGAG